MWWSLYFGSSYFFYLPSYLPILIDSIMHTLPLIFYDSNGFANYLDFYPFFNHSPPPGTSFPPRRVNSSENILIYLILTILTFLYPLFPWLSSRIEPTSMEAFICFGPDGFTVYKFKKNKTLLCFSEHVLHILNYISIFAI